MPASPRTIVTATAPAAAASAGQGSQAKGTCISWATISQAASEPLSTPNRAVAVPKQQVFERVGSDQPGPGGAQRLQDHRVIDPVAVAGGERAAQHQRR